MSYAQTESAPERTQSERRRACRWRPARLSSSVGRVVDLSTDGLRVISRRRLQGTLEVALYRRHLRPIIVRARVVWIRRVGFDRFVVGMVFEDRPAQLGRRLACLSADIPAAAPPRPATDTGDDARHV